MISAIIPGETVAIWRFEESGVDYGQTLSGEYAIYIVLLSVFIACVAAYTALTVASRMSDVEKTGHKYVWLAIGSTAMGLGIWAMHFIGMLAFSMDMPVGYSIPITILSVIPAIIGGTVTLLLLRKKSNTWQRNQVSAFCLAVCIGLMHYIGMEAMRMPSIFKYDAFYFFVSIVVAHGLASLALYFKYVEFSEFSLFKRCQNIISAIGIGLSISGMHYTAMAATRMYASDVAFSANNLLSDNALISAVIIITFLLLLIVIIVAYVDKEFSKIKASLYQSEKKFRYLVEDSLQGIFVHRNFKPLFANQKCADILGYRNPEEIMALDSILEIFWPAEEQERIRGYKTSRMENSEAPAFYECRGMCKDGSLIWLECHVSMIEWQGENAIQVSIVDITKRKQEKILMKQSKSLTELLHAIALSTTVSTNPAEFIQATLKNICTFKDLPVGHAYLIDPEDKNKLLPTESWFFSDKERFQEFKKVTMEMIFIRGIGLPGRILQTKKPAWIIDIQQDENFPRADLIHNTGLHSGFGLPILLDDKVKGVLEFFTKDKKEIDQSLFNELLQIGTQIGHFFEHYESSKELHKLSRAVEASSSIVIITNTDGEIEYVNPKFTEITGYTKEEALGKNPRFLKSGETPESVYKNLWETISSGEEWKGEFHNRKKDGSYYWGRSSFSSVKDANGNITHFLSIQEDVTLEYELTEQLNYQASHDALTGLINRREFERRAERLFLEIQHHKEEHALCFMDLDQFKVVNDTCGHTAGDELLRQLSQLLQSVVRQRDTLARLGGDEFGLLMEHCSLDHAHRVASSLLNAVQDFQFSWEGQSFRVGVSIGLVAITEAIPNLSELLKQADAACYMAKDMGRNRIHVYRLEDSKLAQRHGEMQWVTRLYRALEEDRFCLYAQAIVPLDSCTDKHYELLVRMVDEKGEIIPPGAFLPAAERYNLISKIDCWVIKKAFSLLAANPVFQNQINFISINLSGQSITEHQVLQFIITQLAKFRIEGKKICFEITETATISNLSTAIKFISILKELGCRFALDDFGSGLSSFGYLKNLPVNYLKIDGMFVRDIVDDPIDHALVKSINEIGQVMGMQTIAEFVENDEIKEMLKEIGVNYAQGYGVGKPLPLDDLLGRSNNVTKIRNLK